MPRYRSRLATLVSTLADDVLIAEPLLFPEASCCVRRRQRLRKLLHRRLRELVRRSRPAELYQRRLAELPTLGRITVRVPAPLRQVDRRSPVELTLQYVRWRQAADAVVAFLPALGVEVVAPDFESLDQRLEPQIQAALARRKAGGSLRELVRIDRYGALEIRPLAFSFKLPTLKQVAQKQLDESRRVRSVLKEVATDLVERPGPRVHRREPLVARLAELLGGRSSHAVLLVGPSGVGKSALVAELARRRADYGLGTARFWSTSGSRLVAGMSGFGMWQDRCQQVVKEVRRTGAVVHLGDLLELIEAGKGGGSTYGVAALLRESLADGSLKAVVECTAEQAAAVERDLPQLLEAFVTLEVPPTTPEETRAVLSQVAAELLEAGGRPIADDALAEIDRLHRRYAAYSAPPGRAVRFLRNLADPRDTTARPPDAPPPPPVGPQEAVEAFSRETGLPLVMLDDRRPLDPTAVRDWFERRIVGQPEPTAAATDLLASIKTRLARTGRPLASLLFIGPTGVGKTETAKALAEFLYQDPQRMIRFDMSEFATPGAVERLVGGPGRPAGLLTQKVRDQPFMVVLLDEFEKAHPLVFDLLLQILGDGRLTDAVGRTTDFTNSVVIMTSNLGAETYRATSLGFSRSSDRRAAEHFEREVRSFLRPELFNRIDRIVAFAPLDAAAIAAVARRELAEIARRDGLRLRDVRLEVSPAAAALLARQGYDARYGARPLKRAVARLLVAPLAERLCRYGDDVTIVCRADAADGADSLTFDVSAAPRVVAARRVPPGAPSAALAAAPAADSIGAVDELQRLTALRRKTQQFDRCAVALNLRNEIARLKQAERQERRRRRRAAEAEAAAGANGPAGPRFQFTAEQARILAREKLLRQLDSIAREVRRLEDDSLVAFYDDRPLDAPAVGAAREELEFLFGESLFELYAAHHELRELLTIAVFGAESQRVLQLAEAYDRIAAREGALVQRFWLKMHDPELVDDNSSGIVFRLSGRGESGDAADVYAPGGEKFWRPTTDVIGVALQIRSSRACALLEGESGTHKFVAPAEPDVRCHVETLTDHMLNYTPPHDVGRSTAFQQVKVRRTYDEGEGRCYDEALAGAVDWRRGPLEAPLAACVQNALTARVWRMLDEC